MAASLKNISTALKTGKFTQISAEEIDKVISSTELTNYRNWISIALNPNLTTELIDKMFDKINEGEFEDRGKKDGIFVTRRKNRDITFDILIIHPNLSETNKTLLIKSAASRSQVIKNPALSKKQLQLYFDTWVVPKGRPYAFVFFEELVMGAKNIVDGAILSHWYESLKQFADWKYSDNQWYSIVNAFLKHPQCPVEVLKDIASAPIQTATKSNPLGAGFSEKYRIGAVEHQNSTPEVRLLAYELTKDIKYLPQEAKDIFLF